MNVLVTGATGFVGRHLLTYLAAHLEANLTGLTRIASDNRAIASCELTDARQVNSIIKSLQPALVFHVAGSFTNDFETDYASNVLAAKNILEACAVHSRDSRIMLMGSAAEYGEVCHQDNPVREERLLNPISVYGWSKAAQSLLAPLYANRYGLAVMVARTFNLSGAGMSERLFTGRVERQIADVLAGKASRISVGALDAKRDYIDIEDACAMYLSIATKGLPGESYNVGSGIAISMRELLRTLLEAHGLDESVVDESRDNQPDKEVSMIYADISKVRVLMRSGSHT